MERELIFLVSASPPGSEIAAGVPCRIKTSVGNTLVAFVSEDLGRQLISGRALDNLLGLLTFSKLAPDALQNSNSNSKAKKILLFEHAGDVAEYLKEGSDFDFSRHIVSFEDATRRLQAAL